MRGELRSGFLLRVLEESGGAVVEGVRERGGRLDPAEAVGLKRKGFEKRAADAERVYRGAEIVVEAGKRDFAGGAGSAELGVALVDVDGDAALGEGDRGGEAVGSGADDVGGLQRHISERRRRSGDRQRWEEW